MRVLSRRFERLQSQKESSGAGVLTASTDKVDTTEGSARYAVNRGIHYTKLYSRGRQGGWENCGMKTHNAKDFRKE